MTCLLDGQLSIFRFFAGLRAGAGTAPGGAITFCLRPKSNQKHAFNAGARVELAALLRRFPQTMRRESDVSSEVRSALCFARALVSRLRSTCACSSSLLLLLPLAGEGWDEGLLLEPHAAIDLSSPHSKAEAAKPRGRNPSATVGIAESKSGMSVEHAALNERQETQAALGT